MQLCKLSLIDRYATDEAEFTWFDWGKDYCALVYEPLLVIWQGASYTPDSLSQALDWIADRVQEDTNA